MGSRILLSLPFWLSEAADPCEGCVLGFANPALPSVLAIGSGRSVPGVRPWVCESHYPLRSSDRKRPIRVRGASLGSRPALALATLSWLRVKSTVGTRGFSYKCSGIAKHCTHEGSSQQFSRWRRDALKTHVGFTKFRRGGGGRTMLARRWKAVSNAVVGRLTAHQPRGV